MDPDDMMKTPTKKKGEYPGPVWREDDPIARDIERGPLAEHTIAKVPDVFGLSWFLILIVVSFQMAHSATNLRGSGLESAEKI